MGYSLLVLWYFGPVVSCISVGLFYSLNKLIVTPSVVRRSPLLQWRWRNITVSLIHSAITGLASILCFYEVPKMAEDMIEIHTNKSHLLVALSTGYFIYDFIDMSLNHRCRNSYELMAHHAFVILCFGITVCTKLYVGYALAALLVEVNNVFLHVRQLMGIVNISKSNPWYRLNSLVNLATFILFRVVTLAWMTRWLVVHRELVPLYAYTCGSIGLAAIVLMSIVLFFRLLNSDFGPKRNKEREAHSRPNEALSLEFAKKKD